jgi:hypothetical protein
MLWTSSVSLVKCLTSRRYDKLSFERVVKPVLYHLL